MNFTDPIEEDKRLDIQIAAILSQKASDLQKERQLKELKKTAATPLGLSHISYYQKRLKAKRHVSYARSIAVLLLSAYFLWILYHMYFYIYPEKEHPALGIPFTSRQFALLLCCLPIILLCRYLIPHMTVPHVSWTKYRKQTLVICYFFLTVLSAVYQLCICVKDFQESAPSYIAQSYVGSWSDTISQRCSLTIDCENDTYYSISIHWSQSSCETYLWDFTGTYDETINGIVYSGDQIHAIYHEDGKIEKSFEYTDGSGFFYLDEDSFLHWYDSKNDPAERCLFEKNEEE